MSCLSLVSCKRPEPRPETVVDTVQTAPRPIVVHTYITRSLDSSVPPPDTTTLFHPMDTIHGIIRTENAASGSVIVGRWFMLPSGIKIAESSARLEAGTNLSHFDLINENEWLPGAYRLQILVDNTLRDSASFSVESLPKPQRSTPHRGRSRRT